MPVAMCFGNCYVKLDGRDAGPSDFFKRHYGAGFQRIDGTEKGGLARAGIGQRAHQHIAADAGEGVEIADPGHVIVF